MCVTNKTTRQEHKSVGRRKTKTKGRLPNGRSTTQPQNKGSTERDKNLSRWRELVRGRSVHSTKRGGQTSGEMTNNAESATCRRTTKPESTHTNRSPVQSKRRRRTTQGELRSNVKQKRTTGFEHD